MKLVLGILIIIVLFSSFSYAGLYKISEWSLKEIFVFWISVFILTALIILSAILIVG
ncbi:hypothetical protein NGC82_13950 [Enterococcus casseliflavus]|nr:hypothetical protein [Enterococcus casseliflavus]